jgi:hypothetical protein
MFIQDNVDLQTLAAKAMASLVTKVKLVMVAGHRRVQEKVCSPRINL